MLSGIKGTEARKECVALGEEAGLNLAVITRTVVENVRKKHSSADFMLPAESAAPHDTGVITEVSCLVLVCLCFELLPTLLSFPSAQETGVMWDVQCQSCFFLLIQ